MSSEPAIRVENVGKAYNIYAAPHDRLKQMIVPRLRRAVGMTPNAYFRAFQAVRDVSFEVGRGETVGIVGRNGSGKSTLLQMICGTLTPTSGRVVKSGRVAALLELGAGFNPEFTGRENAALNAAILGLQSHEIQELMPRIEAFADIGSFMDLPVKTYSSGMYVRLAFAVQAQVDPDILIVDEALAVGDARFQAKCFARLEALKAEGTSILLVTHSTEQIVTHCDRAILLEQGVKVEHGEPRLVVNRYLDLLYGRAKLATSKPTSPRDCPVLQLSPALVEDQTIQEIDPEFSTRAEANYSNRPLYNPSEYRWGDGAGEILDYIFVCDGAAFPPLASSGCRMTLYVRYRYLSEIEHPIFGITIKTKEGVVVYGTNSENINLGVPSRVRKGEESVLKIVMTLRCGSGDYLISLGLASRDAAGDVVPHDRRYDSIHIPIEQGDKFIGICDFEAEIGYA